MFLNGKLTDIWKDTKHNHKEALKRASLFLQIAIISQEMHYFIIAARLD